MNSGLVDATNDKKEELKCGYCQRQSEGRMVTLVETKRGQSTTFLACVNWHLIGRRFSSDCSTRRGNRAPQKLEIPFQTNNCSVLQQLNFL